MNINIGLNYKFDLFSNLNVDIFLSLTRELMNCFMYILIFTLLILFTYHKLYKTNNSTQQKRSKLTKKMTFLSSRAQAKRILSY